MCGIGGRTIAEAQARISFREWQTWLEFRRKRGSLHLGMRIERASALLAMLYWNAHSKEVNHKKIWDFMAHEEEPPISIEDAMKTWR